MGTRFAGLSAFFAPDFERVWFADGGLNVAAQTGYRSVCTWNGYIYTPNDNPFELQRSDRRRQTNVTIGRDAYPHGILDREARLLVQFD